MIIIFSLLRAGHCLVAPARSLQLRFPTAASLGSHQQLEFQVSTLFLSSHQSSALFSLISYL